MENERPNLLLICTDHWRGDCLGRLGHPVVETPHLDSLSARGVTFTRGYTPSASCVPARRCLMTGMTPNETGMLGYRDGITWDYKHTMAGELRDSGYQTICVGKTHFYPRRQRLGFEELYVDEDYAEWLQRQEDGAAWKAHGVPSNSWIGRPSHLPERLSLEHWLVRTATERLEKRDPTRPFFLNLSFVGPHPPLCPPEFYYNIFADKELPEPIVGDWAGVHHRDADYPLDVNAWRGKLTPELNQRARAAFYGYLAFLDAQIGRMIEWLMRAGLLHNTMVVFTSDHGEMLGDHNLWRKTYAYEASARVPFIVVPPKNMPGPRNVEDKRLVGWEDIMPTFLEAAGVDIPETVSGRSLCPTLKGEEVQWRDYYHHEHAPCYHPENANQCIIDQDWKYIWNPINGDEQLFHLAVDPDERYDLAGVPEQQETLAKWRSVLARHLEGRPENLSDGDTLTPGPVPTWRGDNAEQLHMG